MRNPTLSASSAVSKGISLPTVFTSPSKVLFLILSFTSLLPPAFSTISSPWVSSSNPWIFTLTVFSILWSSWRRVSFSSKLIGSSSIWAQNFVWYSSFSLKKPDAKILPTSPDKKSLSVFSLFISSFCLLSSCSRAGYFSSKILILFKFTALISASDSIFAFGSPAYGFPAIALKYAWSWGLGSFLSNCFKILIASTPFGELSPENFLSSAKYISDFGFNFKRFWTSATVIPPKR